MKADPKPEAAARKPTKILIIAGVAVLALLAGGGGAAWFFMKDDDAAPVKKERRTSRAAPPEYVTVEPFTVNLQPENGDQYLQVQFTLQVSSPEQVEVFKANMAQVRSRVLLLLSGKKASDINTVEGKRHLAGEILTALKEPFVEKGEQQDVTDVLFTSFIIQ
ncbi:flagellar basal body-associated protein FliL [Massilia horti]|uniref:Flagellar protein FliL n=1 Tax=Massilia horti TaxID=2562153 RepID=A0A4Y9T4T6_9BURK|nr:flagellar basal body-associated protein FliL [Massilia horti]TFW32087.1 flagellar basal body-associated protein FliL [Massilia horti]